MDFQSLIDTLTGTIQIGKFKLPTWIIPVAGAIGLFVLTKVINPQGVSRSGSTTSGGTGSAPSVDAGLAGLQAQIGGIQSSVTQNKSEFDLNAEDVTSRISNLATSQAADKTELSGSIAAVQSQLTGSIAAVQNQLTGTGGLISQTATNTAGIQSLIGSSASALGRIVGLESRQNASDNAVGNISAVSQQANNLALGLNSQLNNPTGLVAQLRNAIASITDAVARVSGVEGRASNLEFGFNTLNDRVSSAELASAGFQGSINSQNTRLKSLEGLSGTLRNDITSLGSSIAGITNNANNANITATNAAGTANSLRDMLLGRGTNYADADAGSVLGIFRNETQRLQDQSVRQGQTNTQLANRVNWLYSNLISLGEVHNLAFRNPRDGQNPFPFSPSPGWS